MLLTLKSYYKNGYLRKLNNPTHHNPYTSKIAFLKFMKSQGTTCSFVCVALDRMT